MYKELIIIIIIIMLVIVGNIITQNNTNKTVETISEELDVFKNEISNKNVRQEDAQNHIGKINDTWDKRSETLAYYIEHDELEKVETNLTGLRSFIESKEYSDALAELDKTVFVLRHIEDKNKFNLQNVF